MLPEKEQVLIALRAAITDELDAIERMAADARDEVTSEETRQEGKYDTRATEASYLARGQAARIQTLRRLLAWTVSFDPTRPVVPPMAQVGALVRLEGERDEVLFMAPAGGNRLQVGDTTVRVISPASPLGRALVQRGVDDVFEVQTPRGRVEYELTALR